MHFKITIDEADMSAPQEHSFCAAQVVIYSARAPGKTTVNEDSAALFATDERHGVLVVADGAGGQRSGAQASQIAIDALAASLRTAPVSEHGLRGAILTGIETANQQILALGTGAASTVVAVEMNDGCVRSFHVGDSLALLVGQRGRLRMQTVSHSPVGYAVEAGLIDENEAMRHEERHVVSNMLGMQDMRIELGTEVRMAAKDTMLLASDGLFDNLHVEEIIDIIRCGPLADAARQLAEAAGSRMLGSDSELPGKPDDMTFVLMRYR
ncbi:MAG: protein phosphatase 2C domain-containing protein [Granulosicoccaceae bacterium]|jgi:serine/threonine protein phosphatase PrpC